MVDVKAEYLGLSAQGWREMLKNWWDLALAYMLVASLALGSSFIALLLYQKIRLYWQKRHEVTELPKSIERYLKDLRKTTIPLCPEREYPTDSKSFGAFMGKIDTPPTAAQCIILSQWDIVVLDPFQAGVLDALATNRCSSKHVLGRVDVALLAAADGSVVASKKALRSLNTVTRAVVQSFKRTQDMYTPFTGILMANWEEYFPPVVCNELIRYFGTIGLDVYLEVSPPSYLSEDVARAINMEPIRGIVCRNGSIFPNGERRNYFQMAEMRHSLRALAAKSAMVTSTVIMWDTIDDAVKLEHAVVKRSFTWCNFSSALSWIGPKSALVDADVAIEKTISGEPLGAMMWLKEDATIKAHEIWRTNDRITETQSGDHEIYSVLNDFIPDLASKVALGPTRPNQATSRASTADGTDIERPWSIHPAPTNLPQFSSHGLDITELGCFQLGLHCSSDDYTNLVGQQNRLKDLGLLECLQSEELHAFGEALRGLCETEKLWASTPVESLAVKELLALLAATNGGEDDGIKIYVGLDSGFKTTGTARFCQFWGLYDYDISTGVINIYISGKTKDRAGSILHTFMSSRECSRAQCFMAEIALAEYSNCLVGDWMLSARLQRDIELLTPTEAILFMQRLAVSDVQEFPLLAARIRACCEYQLLEVPSIQQLRSLNATTYLEGKITAEKLVLSRLNWYTENGVYRPNTAAAVSLFNEIEIRVSQILMGRESEIIARLELVLQTILKQKEIDASADLFCLSVFCAFRKLAINEVYMEINDRNPLPNPQSDQSACFAEMFALGSGCEQYFDMTPTALGKILTEMSQSYYKKNQPPKRDDSITELPTAYSSKLIDLDSDAGERKVPFYYHATFLGIFAIPAFIDILLLTTTGRGLYLTTYMAETEKTMATTALMISLFLCGATGTWVSSGGSYYLYSMTFSAMNMFVLTRFIAGWCICLTGGTLALVIIGVTKGFYAGFIFMIYFFILTTYLTLLATLAIYQFPGFNFQSGRLIIMSRIPILFISPILTLFIHKHDLIVYLVTLTIFVISLLLGARTVMSQWSTWYLNIPCITDVDVANWYQKTYGLDNSTSEKLSTGIDISTTPIPRQALLREVLKEKNRRPWQKATADKQVQELAQGYEATIFMMDWYCKYSRAKMTYAYSPTWNLQCKAAVCTLQDMQKGVKLHNAFVHWRNAGDELWGGVLYFVIALLDKWVALLSGGSIVGLSDASSEKFRLAVGFGLAYYLIGAVSLDGVSQPLWQLAQKNLDQGITSLEFLRQAAINDASAKRVLYWKYFLRFFFMHVWGLAFSSALMWTFDNSRDGTIMYMAYVGAYMGLLWYQYNRIFTGPLAFKEPLVAVAVGLTVGLVLHSTQPRFSFNSVISLAVATWTAALFSAWTAHLGGPQPKLLDTGFQSGSAIHASTTLGHGHQSSPNALKETVESICALPEELRYRLDPFTHPGVEVIRILTSGDGAYHSTLVQTAFPDAASLLRKTAEFWIKGDTVVDLVPMRHLLQAEQKIRSITSMDGNRLHVFVFLGLDLVGDEWVMDIRRNCKVVAEAIIQATCEFRFGLSHEHSILAEVLAVSSQSDSGLSLPEGVKRQLQNSASERHQVIKSGDKTLLSYLLLGLDCDIDWDLLPKNIRSFLLKRACGEPCHVSDSQLEWISSRFCDMNSADIEGYIARCNLGATLTVLINSFAGALETDYTHRDLPEPLDSSYEHCIETQLSPSTLDEQTKIVDILKRPFSRFRHAFKHFVKFFSVALVADPEMQRELRYTLRDVPWIVSGPVTFALSAVWIYTKSLQRIIIPLVIFHGRVGISRTHRNMKGMTTTIRKNHIAVESLSGPSTCFVTSNADKTFTLHQYAGHHSKNPTGLYQLMAINTYSEKLVLIQREEYAKEALVSRFAYEYPSDRNGRISRLGGSKQPIERQCTAGLLTGQLVFYDERGYIASGSFMKDDNLVQFKFEYRKNAKFDDELLRAEYILPHIAIQVVWSAPPANQSVKKLDKWIPHTKVTEAVYTQGTQVYTCKWHYEHKFHPIINTTLNGQEVATPAMVLHDWFGVLKKPQSTSFVNENPLHSFRSVKTNILTRFLGFNTRWHPISTSRARTHLWKSWKEGKELDACTARWLDEWSLRKDKDLKPYWNARDMSRLDAGENYLNSRADTIMARVDIDPEISSWTPLAFKISDLVSFGTGGDARINTRTQEAQMQDTDTELHILAMDTGTWPNEGGGVSACRRDMVNNLDSIRWHILAENANDFGVPKFQIEKNVQSLTVLPLWGMDFLTPTHGIFQNCLDSSIQHKIHNLRDDDIKKRFLPILRTLVRGSRAINIDRQLIEDSTKALVDLNTYFESSRHWGEVWKSDIVRQAWRELWLTEDMPNCRPISQWLDAEIPTLLHLDNALDMWHRYLFIFSIPVPEKIPDVFQASHHFAGASYGIVCKVKRNCTFHVWDHCISWREVTVFLSSSMSFDSPFVCNSLISLSRLASTLILHHADVVLPCADFFNPGWEVEIGTQENTIEHRKSFARKIDPVVNGICNMESFQPIEKIKSKVPTVVMLSHVRFVKDIKTAILAADMIVNIWGFTDYQLHIYGDMEKAPAYSVECQEIIAAKSLRDNVVLKGLGSPSKVLEDAWLFLNSSVSEGLPLAMGEAALTGVPVVCTDVGASFRVVTDPVTWDRFSAVVAPNDAVSLARAQVNVLALLDEWSKYADDPPDFNPKLSLTPTAEEVAIIQKRMYEKQEQRRRLGMMGRDNVLNSFSEGRYLREHEQMLWVGKYQAPSYNSRQKPRPLSDLSSYVHSGGKTSQFTSSASSYMPPRIGSSCASITDGTSSTEGSIRGLIMGANGTGQTSSYASSLTIIERPFGS